ncbi:MAG: prolyl oligopeptidase family serine peptidase [Planctomycetota bacterium]|jgi:dipeptidyl aminopeptidase/acylaminoacyl peptidase
MFKILSRIALLLCICSAAGAQERMSPELLWQLQRISDPQLSPDGKKLLYHQRSYDLKANSGRTQIVLMDLASGDTKTLSRPGSSFNARWSPDGSQIAFLANRDGAAQIHVMDAAGTVAVQVSDHPGGVSNLAWSPKGTHFSFTSEVKLDQQVTDIYPDLPQAKARLYDDLLVRHWDHWKPGTYSHLFVITVGGGEARDLMAGERVDTPLKPFGGGEQIAWSPDGKQLCYTAKRVDNPESSTNSDLYLVSIEGGEHRNLTEGMPGYETNPSFSPDGSKLAFQSMARGGFEADRNRLMVLELGSAEITELTVGFDQMVDEFVWAPDGYSLILSSDYHGSRPLYRIAARGSEPERITSGRFHFGSLIPSPDGKSLLALRQQTERPFELVRLDLNATPATGAALTDVNGEHYDRLALPRVEERWFEASDGKRIHSWVVYPPDFDPKKKWPMLLYCQGGPQGQVGQWFSYRWNFHLMAAQGYVVLAVNRRGLPGFGREWNDQISRDWGGQAMQDLLAATDGMFEEPFIDRQRTAAVGASFGGYSTFWLMGHDQEDRFCAMVSHAGVFNLESMYLSTEELFFVNWDLGGPFWSSPEVQKDYDRFSPHRYVQNWDTPLLVIHGQKDYRVPLPQGLGAFTAAQVQGVPSRFLYFPEENHWILAPQNGVLWHRVFFDWLDRYCKTDD